MSNADDIHSRIGAYVLDALPDDERREFETHLDGCVACQQEVRGLTETTALVGAAVAQSAPASLRERVRTQVSQTRQLPPPLLPAASMRRRWLHRATMLAAAACLVIAVAAGVLAVRANDQAARLRAEQRAAAAVLSASDVRVDSGVHTRYGTATLAVSRDRDAILFLLHDPRRLAGSHDYQLWFLSGAGAARSAGVLPDTGEPSAPSLVAHRIGDARQVAVTVEPAGGSRQPTTRPVLVLSIP